MPVTETEKKAALHLGPTETALLGLMAAATLAGMPILVLAPFFADDMFHKGSQGLGFLMGAMGVGAPMRRLMTVIARRAQGWSLAST